jgi:uncharacterized protein (TIGR02246 family)
MRGPRLPTLASLLVLAACTPAQTGFTEAQRAQAESQVREVVAQLATAMNSQDPDQVFAHYRESREFVLIGCTDLMFGTEYFTRVLRPFLGSPREAPLEKEVLRIQILTPEAAVVTLQGGSAGGPPLFWTLVLVREGDGRWLVAHEHQSWPGCREPAHVHRFGDLSEPYDFQPPRDPGNRHEPGDSTGPEGPGVVG